MDVVSTGICKIVKSNNSYMPKMSTIGSAGYDLRTPVDFVVKPQSSCKVDLGISIELPFNMYVKIESRSGLASKDKIIVIGGVVDNDYRGNINVILFNLGKKMKKFKRGDKIAQMIIHTYHAMPMVVTDILSSTERNDGGFGSTGR
ncbi:dUTPase [Hemileuca sp. nucleopolyhedrovirus]|uniref:dUTP diphosphatase n=1 Tax=Hemileuca sp. nucleopolyhedrovirus TaxID=1367203 RepID=S5N3B0_9ABAC|nr:dUTPase [Hemileuca sp. nucleopolyhedrovirus]AGR56855.1 dUTPase [Hemileuca sp. nucleopolyhedrovirus]